MEGNHGVIGRSRTKDVHLHAVPCWVAEMLAVMYNIHALYLAWFTGQEHVSVLDVAERLVHYGIHIDITERDVDRLKKDLRRQSAG